MKIEILKQKGYRFLWINDYLWMWDIPIEKTIQKRIADEAYGDVLVAGYGLGIVQKYLSQNKKVTSIITVELYPEIEELCKKEYGRIYGDILFEDFYKYETPLKFDCVIGDIWEDIIPESLEKYKKFKNKARQLLNPAGKTFAWGKDFFEYLIAEGREIT